MSMVESATGEQEVLTRERPAHSGRVVSKDGTTIAFDRVGRGPPVILVVGALCSRSLGPGIKLAPELAKRFTVFTYDRRGRGDSGDKRPYEVDREVEDLEALIGEAGGSALVFGHSSGAVLALTAAAQGVAIRKLAMYEAPLIVDRSRPTTEDDWEQIEASLADGRRGDAVKAFLKCVGVPAIGIAVMRWLPVWAKITAVAPTLSHDGAIVRDFQRGEPLPARRWAHVEIPMLAIDGEKSPAWMHNATRALASVLTDAQYRTLEGQTHDVNAKALAPVLTEFFQDGSHPAHPALQ
jgi:pimeloyl-ACP methyl ester carboxylesterase